MVSAEQILEREIAAGAAEFVAQRRLAGGDQAAALRHVVTNGRHLFIAHAGDVRQDEHAMPIEDLGTSGPAR